MCRWGKLWTRYEKIRNPSAPSKEPGANRVLGAKTGYYTPPHQRGGQTPWARPLARPLRTPLPSPHIRNQLAPAWGGSQQGNLLLVFTSPGCRRCPSKALSKFLNWPLITIYWLRKVMSRWALKLKPPGAQPGSCCTERGTRQKPGQPARPTLRLFGDISQASRIIRLPLVGLVLLAPQLRNLELLKSRRAHTRIEGPQRPKPDLESEEGPCTRIRKS